jgi:hypothetical protein
LEACHDFFEIAVLTLLSLNVWVTYYMLRRLTVATLTSSFTVAHWLNPRRAKWFGETFEKTLAMDYDDAQYDELNAKLAEENPECQLGREPLIAEAFDAYKECRRVPNKFRNLERPSEP